MLQVRENLRGDIRAGARWVVRGESAEGSPAGNCFDCGAAIVAGDDDVLVCIQCGGRNRRVGHLVGSNPPLPVGAKPLPPPGPPLREGLELRLTKELQPSARPTSGPPAPTVYPQMPTVKPPGSAIVAPLTAEDVRKVVREEIERAKWSGSKSGRMGPG